MAVEVANNKEQKTIKLPAKYLSFADSFLKYPKPFRRFIVTNFWVLIISTQVV